MNFKVYEIPFNSRTKWQMSIHALTSQMGRQFMFLKGAPDVLIGTFSYTIVILLLSYYSHTFFILSSYCWRTLPSHLITTHTQTITNTLTQLQTLPKFRQMLQVRRSLWRVRGYRRVLPRLLRGSCGLVREHRRESPRLRHEGAAGVSG